jgi:hypothetical protein
MGASYQKVIIHVPISKIHFLSASLTCDSQRTNFTSLINNAWKHVTSSSRKGKEEILSHKLLKYLVCIITLLNVMLS